jgi:hypothetical protein
MSKFPRVLVVGIALVIPAGSWAQKEMAKVEMTLDYTEAFKPGVSLIWSPCGQVGWAPCPIPHKIWPCIDLSIFVV